MKAFKNSQLADIKQKKLTKSESELVKSSRKSIINTGISGSYFDKHFKLENVSDKPSDRRVVWIFKLAEYSTRINDAVGFYTNGKGQRVNVHSVGELLVRTRDIKKTIDKKSAEKLLEKCIGSFESSNVVFVAQGNPPVAALYLSALSKPIMPEPPTKEETKDKNKQDPDKDVLPTPKKKPLIYIGFVNLQTGECTKGLAQAGSPRPTQ